MKKFLSLFLILCLVLTITGCGTENQETVTEQPAKEQPSETVQPGNEGKPTEEVTPTEKTPLIEEDQKGNLIPGGSFDESNNMWGIYTESGGIASYTVKDGQMEVAIEKTGRVKHAVQIYCDGFRVFQNALYKMSFDMKSSVDRTIEWRIQINGGDYHAYAGEGSLPVTTEMQHYEFTFTMEEPTDLAPRFCFNFGFHEPDGELPAHTVCIDNVELIVLDDSSAVIPDTSIQEGPAININQVGYRPDDIKLAIFRDSSIDTKFDVVDVNTGKTVFTGNVTGSAESKGAGEIVAYGDFSGVTEPGRYKIVAENSGESYEFVIGDDVYEDIFADTIRMFYMMRCGCDLSRDYAGDFAHKACHTREAIIYGTGKAKDVSGGWHDAGDYGRYVVPGAKAAADLLLTYEDYSQMFTDNVGIPESGNGIPDVLDEVRYELEWMLKMQDEKTGGVYHKVTGLNFDGTVMPEEATDELYILPISNCATGDFAAVMAIAARVYGQHDSAFAKKCLSAAKTALAYMESHENNGGFKNPEDVLTGEYPDITDTDEYFWALCELYKTTGDPAYNTKLGSVDINSIYNGLGWESVGLYGFYSYLTSDNQDTGLANKIKDSFMKYISAIKSIAEKDGYFSMVGSVYPWGSNMKLANSGMAVLMANRIYGEDTDLAKKQLDYLLGANPTSYCFVTGHGTLSPENTHHRPSMVLNKTMKGMLVGGANSNLEDPYARNVLAGLPPAKCYADNAQSYSCNEITIYWNSPLVYLLAGIQAAK